MSVMPRYFRSLGYPMGVMAQRVGNAIVPRLYGDVQRRIVIEGILNMMAKNVLIVFKSAYC